MCSCPNCSLYSIIIDPSLCHFPKYPLLYVFPWLCLLNMNQVLQFFGCTSSYQRRNCISLPGLQPTRTKEENQEVVSRATTVPNESLQGLLGKRRLLSFGEKKAASAAFLQGYKNVLKFNLSRLIHLRVLSWVLGFHIFALRVHKCWFSRGDLLINYIQSPFGSATLIIKSSAWFSTACLAATKIKIS